MRKKVYIVLTEYRGCFNDDETHTDILGVYDTKEKALKKVEEDFNNAFKDTFMANKDKEDLNIDKCEENYCILDECNSDYIETYIKEERIL